jgi:hypothetical protein
MKPEPSTEPAQPAGGGAKIPTTGPGKGSAGEFGREGTNKTIPEPKPDNAPSEELGNTPHIEKTPYTRG